MFVKVCGITSAEDGRLAVRCGATHLGVVLAPGSPRRADGGLVRTLREENLAPLVGVFQDNPADEVLRMAPLLDYVQLHGGYEPGLCRALRDSGAKVIWAVPVSPSGEWPDAVPACDFVLLDAAAGGRFGGTGTAFDWARCPRPSAPFLLAGGITPENLGGACRALRPDGIDLSSSLERSPGRKDPDRLAALAHALTTWKEGP